MMGDRKTGLPWLRYDFERGAELMTESFAEIRKIYADYLEKTVWLNENRKLGEGIFGTAGPKTDPCHGIFADALKIKLDAAAQGGLSSAGAREILKYMIETPVEQENNQLAYWMLLAVHGYMLSLAETLDPSDAKILLELYGRLYPKRQWLPVQKRLADVLRVRGKG
ncbi:hypothetical protein OBV_16270 [Oscillibacter valericigenes Sjm18-20]|nr:hypothetical protein OBV_16270 [Oscillibacter valericigenes Sjm18-20]